MMRLSSLKKNRLFYKFTGVLVILLTVFFILSGGLILKKVHQQNLNTFKNNVQLLTKMVADHAAFHLAKLSYFSIEEQASRLQANKDNHILSLLVYNHEGIKVNSSGIEHEDITTPKKHHFVVEIPCLYSTTQENFQKQGKVIAVFSLETFYQQASRWQFIYVFSSISALFLLSFAMAFLVFFFISKPLKNLADSTRKLAQGDFETQFSYKSKDEIGDLSEDFNIMASHLKTQMAEIKELNHSLEHKVEVRTKELAEERNKLKQRNIQMEQELIMARRIQEQLIPSSLPALNLAALYKPMDQIGGDFYDFFPFPDNKLGVFVSDVSGHGIPAALITTMLKSFLLRAGNFLLNPSQTLFYLNQSLVNQTANNFITAFYGVYDFDSQILTYSEAGHPSPFLLKEQEVSQLPKTSRGLPLAVFDNKTLQRRSMVYENNSVNFKPNEKLLIYTDGLIEATPLNQDHHFFMEHGLEKTLDELKQKEPQELIHNLYLKLKSFRGDEDFDDDVCLVCLKS